MYAQVPSESRRAKRLRGKARLLDAVGRKKKEKRRGLRARALALMRPDAVEARKRAAINLRAYQVGALDNPFGAAEFLQQQQFGDDWWALQQQQIQYGDEATLGELGLKLKLPKFIRKMKPLKVLGKAARVAAPFIPGVGVVGAAAISAGGAVLQKGKKAKLFKDVGKAAVIGGAGRFAVKKLARPALKLAKKVPTLFRRRPALPAPPGATPAIAPPVEPIAIPEVPTVMLPPELQRPSTVEEIARQVGAVLPTFLPTPGAPPTAVPTTAMELPPGEALPEVPGEAPPAGPALAGMFGGDMGKLMLMGAGLFVLSQVAGGGRGRRRGRRR